MITSLSRVRPVICDTQRKTEHARVVTCRVLASRGCSCISPVPLFPAEIRDYSKCTVAEQFVAQSSCRWFDFSFALLWNSLVRSPLNCDDFSPRQTVATSSMPNIVVTSTERLLEDHESVVDVVSSWPWDSENKLVLNNRREKYALFRNPQVNRSVIIYIVPGACFSKVPRTFRARKTSSQTAIHFF